MTPEPPASEAQFRIPATPTGGCIPFIRTHCVPCDPGIPSASCIPASEWPPVSTTDTGLPEEAQSPVPPRETIRHTIGELIRKKVPNNIGEDLKKKMIEDFDAMVRMKIYNHILKLNNEFYGSETFFDLRLNENRVLKKGIF